MTGGTALLEIQREIRAQIGEPADTLSHTADVLVVACCRAWPDDTLTALARRPRTSTAAEECHRAIGFVSARVRETTEARWGFAHGLPIRAEKLLEAVVLEFFAYWFQSSQNRAKVRAAIGFVREQSR